MVIRKLYRLYTSTSSEYRNAIITRLDRKLIELMKAKLERIQAKIISLELKKKLSH
jgi:hypothetical protein